MSKDTLYLIDGSNYIFRAYYAIGPLSNSKGLPTNALYGFSQMILKMVDDVNPKYMVVVFDTEEPTFRDKLYADYKANREAPPEDLVQQFPYFKPILNALNISVLELNGFEADDVIGTIASRLASDDLDDMIVSGDKDLMQLINDNVKMYDGMKEKRIGKNEVVEKFGVEPAKVIDVLALAGDSVDNVPGVPGVGPKTASKLINEYGSVENVIKKVDELSDNLKQKIKENIEKLELSKQLVTIDINAPVKFEINDFLMSSPDLEKVRDVFGELKFSKLISDIAPQQTIDRSNYKLINSKSDFETLLKELSKVSRFSFDLETTSLNIMNAELVGISMAIAHGNAFYIPVGHIAEGAFLEKKQVQNFDLFSQMDEKSDVLVSGQLALKFVLEKLKPILEDNKIKKIGQNLKYDCAILKRYGINVRGLYFDTMIASYLLNAGGKHNLDHLSLQYLSHKKISYDELVLKGKKKKSFAEVDVDKAMEYSCEDADAALRLADVFLPKLKDAGLEKLYFEMELPLLEVLMDMELVGIRVDKDVLAGLSVEFNDKLDILQKKIYEEAGCEFNINSPKQLGKVLFEDLKLGTPKKTKTGYSTDVGVLEDLASEHQLPELILEYRSLSKLKSTYIDALIDLIKEGKGRVHTSFNQAVAATGRLSSSDPNLQNIPIRTEVGRKIRKAFVAEPDMLLLSADYSQIELRVLAHLSKDEVLIDAFKNNEDIHTITASQIFGIKLKDISKEQRAAGKTVNFATIYGQGAFGLSKQLSIDVAEAKRYIDAYFKRYPKVDIYRDMVLSKARETGFVETLFERKRFVPDLNSKNIMVKQAAERAAFNTVFQGTAADIIKKAMIKLHMELPDKCADAKMLLQVHDELLFEVSNKHVDILKPYVKDVMENVVQLDIPLIVDIGVGASWVDVY